MSIVYATLPLRINVVTVHSSRHGTRYAWLVYDGVYPFRCVDESPATYKTERGAMAAGRRAAYKCSSEQCEVASKWKQPK